MQAVFVCVWVCRIYSICMLYISSGLSLSVSSDLCFRGAHSSPRNFREPVRLRQHTRETNKHSLDPCREADDREEEAVCVEIFKHALNWLSVDPERDAGSAQVQTAAHHVL